MKQKLQSYYPYYEVYTGETNKKNVFIYLIKDYDGNIFFLNNDG